MLFARNAFPAQVTLSWDPPTTNVDGSPLTDLAGFVVYYGPESGVYTRSIDAGKVDKYTVNFLDNGTYFFAVTAYDTIWNESAYSNEVIRTISAPTIVSLTPLLPIATEQDKALTFTAVYSDQDGHTDLKTLDLQVNRDHEAPINIWATYDRNLNTLALYDDAGTAFAGECSPEETKVIQNSRVKLLCAQTTVSAAGNSLTINWRLTPKAAFVSADPYNLWLRAIDNSNTTSTWKNQGKWTVVASNMPPAIVSLAPSMSLTTAQGQPQSFKAVYTDPDSCLNLRSLDMQINTAIGAPNGFWTRYDRNLNRIYLFDDASSAIAGECTPGTDGLLENSQGSINCAQTTVTGSGTYLTINWRIIPKTAFASASPRKIWLRAIDNSDASTPWENQGNWSITPSNTPPVISSLTPSMPVTTERGRAQTFKAVYTDPDGYSNLKSLDILINSISITAGAIFAKYDRDLNTIYLYNDAGSAVAGSCTPGAAVTLSNTQGSINCAQTAAIKTGADIIMNWSITSHSSLTRKLWLRAIDYSGVSTGLINQGNWTTIIANSPPVVNSLTPFLPVTTEQGLPQTFRAVYSDANGHANLKALDILINSIGITAGGIFAKYNRDLNTIYLYNDAGSAVAGSCTPGAALTLSNTQGSINCAQTTVIKTGGTNITIAWNITPSSSFTKKLQLRATDYSNVSTGWVNEGSWTVNTANTPPVIGSLVPVLPITTVQGFPQTFTAVYSDPDGYANLRSLDILVNKYPTTYEGIFAKYNRGLNTISLFNDYGSAVAGSCRPGDAVTLTNLQGSIYCPTSTVAGSGDNLTIVLTIIPNTAFSERLRLMATDNSGASTGWVDQGKWTVTNALSPAIADDGSFSLFRYGVINNLPYASLSEEMITPEILFPASVDNNISLFTDTAAASSEMAISLRRSLRADNSQLIGMYTIAEYQMTQDNPTPVFSEMNFDGSGSSAVIPYPGTSAALGQVPVMSYDVASDGAVHMGRLAGLTTPDGNVIALVPDAELAPSIIIGVRNSSDLGPETLFGEYKGVSVTYYGSYGQAEFLTEKEALTFDGKGACSYASQSGTYEVSQNGKISVMEMNGVVSPDGNFMILADNEKRKSFGLKLFIRHRP
jgi:hypothetical protein